ncbi:imm11 family protein [Corallococcus sp. 4LFB]|uniref:imm11 family protein n=1 Tax=Corallococcus sp. 4LFB TaxID=3383249 RepID=UPI003975D1BA
MTDDNFYDIGIADVHQWVLELPAPASGGELDDPWMFGDGRRLSDPGPLTSRPFREGPQRSFSVANSGRTPIADEQVANVFRKLAPDDVQTFPIRIEGAGKGFHVINATKRFSCVDKKNSREVQIYPSDGVAPERVGTYRAIHGLRIDRTKTAGAQVFRIQGYPSALIVSAKIKSALEEVGNLGVSFERVTGPQEPSPPPREPPAARRGG